MKTLIYSGETFLVYSQCEPSNGDIIYVKDNVYYPFPLKKLRVVRKQYRIEINKDTDDPTQTFHSTILEIFCEELHD